ncbi:hypothetical protein [Gilvimarinus agarilyticus]|uniref:hypothetical protein n=1 Tax=Gilvimarinus agarilyticus TaxID=679259 RepID=UPI0005A0C54D|nr:hypothetical protein [Gilvimarinus agarilyticus]
MRKELLPLAMLAGLAGTSGHAQAMYLHQTPKELQPNPKPERPQAEQRRAMRQAEKKRARKAEKLRRNAERQSAGAGNHA